MNTVAQLLAGKKPIVWAIRPDETVFEAIKLMGEKEVGALLVVEGPSLVGIVSERDYARKVILKGKESHNTKVEAIMTANVISVGPSDTIDRCMELMTTHRIRHLPVLEKTRITGIVSIGDLVQAIIAQQSQTIQQLEGYIMS